MQIFIDGRLMQEPKEGWKAFAYDQPIISSSLRGACRVTTHPVVDAFRKTVRDLLELANSNEVMNTSTQRRRHAHA